MISNVKGKKIFHKVKQYYVKKYGSRAVFNIYGIKKKGLTAFPGMSGKEKALNLKGSGLLI